MEASERRYGWAPDDPRWVDTVVGGNGRLEPPPAPMPRFDETQPAGDAVPSPTSGWTTHHSVEGGPGEPTAPSAPEDGWRVVRATATVPGGQAPPGDSGWHAPSDAAARADVPTQAPAPAPAPAHWPPAPPASAAPWPPVPQAGSVPVAGPLPVPPAGPGTASLPDLFGPPLAIAAGSAGPPSAPAPHAGPSGLPATFPSIRASVRMPPAAGAALPSPAPAPVPLGVQYSASASAAMRPGVRDGGAVGSPGSTHGPGPVSTRLDRQVQVRGRRRGDDEFRRAGRAELFSDDARYGVLFTLTASWYGPVLLLFLGWVLFVADKGATGSQLLLGLLWLAGAIALSLAVAGLLRWAAVGWRALTLSVASALIGGGVATIAHTLSG